MMTFQPRPITSELRRHPWRLGLRVGLLVVVLVCLYDYEFWLDEYALATYHAPAEVAALVASLGLTHSTQALLARTKPQIDDKATFNRDCQTDASELELGCYTHGHIYILEIDNTSLKPEMETVLAHELLHAAWDRLSAGERSELGGQLETVYHGLHDPDLSQRMASYATSEPGEETNELHSILGTEQATLPPPLETYYQRVFTHRSSIVASHVAYMAVFTNQGNALAAQLATIKTLKAQLASLNATMERYKSNGQIAAYNQLVPGQNQLVDHLNDLIDAYDTAINEYNALSKSIDSHTVTPSEPGV